MDRDKAAQVQRLTQSMVILHRSQAKELSTGDFCKGINAIYSGASVKDFERHLADCDQAFLSIQTLHQERQALLRSFIASKR
jgi:hypothetical protein